MTQLPDTPQAKILSAHQLTVAYEQQEPIFSDLNFEIYDHDFIGVIGPNGGGKTTLMRTLLGLIKPQSGEITFYDRNGKEKHDNIAIGYVPQQNSLDKAFPISVEETVAFGLTRRNRWRRSTNDKERVKDALEKVGMIDYRHHSLGKLSGGQLQRVLLARAIVDAPRFLILDEPNTYVDKHFESQLYALLPEINKNTAIAIVSHDIGSISKMARRLFCVNRGLHIHEGLQNICDDCSEDSALHYLSLLDHH